MQRKGTSGFFDRWRYIGAHAPIAMGRKERFEAGDCLILFRFQTCVLLLCCSLALQPVENTQISADVTVPLSGSLGVGWTLTNGSLPAWAVDVPGDLVSDLAAGGLLAARDPLFGAVFRGPYLWSEGNWSYSTSFATNPLLDSMAQKRLILYGVKMAASIALNGVTLGDTASQHLRFAFDVTAALRRQGAGENHLTITMLPSADPANSELRWMGCARIAQNKSNPPACPPLTPDKPTPTQPVRGRRLGAVH